jgi:histidinol dehydrogenase
MTACSDRCPRRDVIASLDEANRGALIKVRDLDEACDICRTALRQSIWKSAVEDTAAIWLPKLRHAGAMFIGRYSVRGARRLLRRPESRAADGAQRALFVPLGVYDFQKRTSILEISAEGAQKLGRIASVLAHGEGLQAHARSAEMRLID